MKKIQLARLPLKPFGRAAVEFVDGEVLGSIQAVTLVADAHPVAIVPILLDRNVDLAGVEVLEGIYKAQLHFLRSGGRHGQPARRSMFDTGAESLVPQMLGMARRIVAARSRPHGPHSGQATITYCVCSLPKVATVAAGYARRTDRVASRRALGGHPRKAKRGVVLPPRYPGEK